MKKYDRVLGNLKLMKRIGEGLNPSDKSILHWEIPTPEVEAMFRVQKLVLDGIKDYPTLPYAKRHIGEFVASKKLRNMQLAAIFGADYNERVISKSNLIYPLHNYLSNPARFSRSIIPAAQDVVAAIKDMVSYGKGEGLPWARENVRQFLAPLKQ